MTQEQLIDLLARADVAWVSVRGTYYQWRRQALVDVAFDRHIGSLSRAGWASTATTFSGREDDDEEPVIESVCTVATDRRGRRRRAGSPPLVTTETVCRSERLITGAGRER